MPYLMGGFPDLDDVAARSARPADAGADLVELGVPFSDPLADGPVIQAAGERALAGGREVDGVLEVGERARGARPGGRHVLRQPVLARGRGALRRTSSRERGRRRPDRPRPPARGGAPTCARPATRPASRSSRWSRRPRPTSAWPAIGAPARGFIYAVSVTGITGEREELAAGCDELVARVQGAHRRAGGGRLRHRHARAGRGGGRRGRRRGDHRQPAGARRRRGARTYGGGGPSVGRGVREGAQVGSAVPPTSPPASSSGSSCGRSPARASTHSCSTPSG